MNLSELQRGHSRRIHTKCGTQLGHVRFEKFMPTPLEDETRSRYRVFPSNGLELASSHASEERMLPVAKAIDESAAP
jgi:hypothetical protein